MRYTEADLLIPTLEILEKNPGGVPTSYLIKELTKILKPTGRDAELLPGRKDTHFSQKVRNLKSHDSLTRRGLALYVSGIYRITDNGKKYLGLGYKELVEALQDQGFSDEDRRKEYQKDYKELVIEEGFLVSRDAKLRKRSRKLVQIAKRYFSIGNKIFCKVCKFNFQDFYGELGRSYIEIHHMHPIHLHDLKGEKRKLRAALKTLAPLCSNCHRMIHRRRGLMLSVQDLIRIVKMSK